ncbi:creatininase family protein [Desulfopila sp. IMCC35006]|uniref:creatininase family protein n=1 Tax=Desulfopila sp. IMCC35006 TaxID=2569542 RepID=UPI0010AB6DAD|nr:creatininase family protein [Desulfopila sp. IMCC35006]TKB23254.1 creatininase family protein [Desulfopila sp. IMCC35006]
MSTNLHKLLELSWVELEALDKNQSIVLLPLSPIEEHGPHLPLGTDILAAQDIAETAAGYLCKDNPLLQVVLSPTIPLGCSDVTADFPGTISLRGKTLYHLLVDFCSGLAKSGFTYIIIANHHLDSVHLKAIMEAIETVTAEFQVQIIETAGRILYSGMTLAEVTKGEELGLSMKTEVHADVRETSYIKYRYPHLLKQAPEQLSPVLINVREGIRNGLKTFKAMGAEQGYIGSPALASENLGRIHLEEQARIIAEMAIKLMAGQALPEINPHIIKYLKTVVSL